MKRQAALIFVLMSIHPVLAACSPAEPPLPTMTATPFKTWTHWPTEIPPTPTPTPTLTPTATITPTPGPTLWSNDLYLYCKGMVTPREQAPAVVQGEKITTYQFWSSEDGESWGANLNTDRMDDNPQVVFCAKGTKVVYLAGTCDYTGGHHIDLYSRKYAIQVYDVHTGKLAYDDTKTIGASGDGIGCPTIEIVSPGTDSRSITASVTYEVIQEILDKVSNFVPTPEATQTETAQP